MPLSSGDQFGPYTLISPLGEGGMGEVWKARDTRLDRAVALKVSKAAFTERFEREARAVAALNQPNICTLHDVGPNYLVMEFVEGVPLKGPLPMEKAVEYAGQILEALDAAHRKGITHRDLKPANILVTKQGIKLLDFGLAKQRTPLPQDGATLTQALTSQGAIVGTLQYMAPEQLQGKDADARSDLFAFGCVFYEMLTGKRAFEGESAASVIAAILEREPAPLTVAPPLERIVLRALAKDPDQRFQTARDLKAAMVWAMEQAPPAAINRSRWKWFAAGALASVVAAFAWTTVFSRPPVEEARALHFQVYPPAGAMFLLGVGGGSAISPDGRAIAFVASSTGMVKLWIRPLDSLTASELPGTEGAQYPFWSPDSRSIGFFSGSKLKRIEVSGGPPVVIADAPNARGGTWNARGTIVFGSLSAVGSLKQVAASGGSPVPLAKANPSGEDVLLIRWPQFLPDGRQFLYAAQSIKSESSGIYLSSLDRPGEKIRLTGDLSAAAYAPPRGKHPGYLLWVRADTLMAQPFDAGHGRLSGDAMPVPGGKMMNATGLNNYPPFSASNEGKVLFNSGADRYQLTWFDRKGNILSTVGQPDRYAALRISPDGSRAAVSLIDSAGNRDIWQLEFARGVLGRLTVGGRGFVAVWSPDGQRLAYHMASGPALFERNTSGAGEGETVLQAKNAVYINDWSPDGSSLLYTETAPDSQNDLWILPRTGDRKPVPFLKSAFNELHGQFSPDGKWIAYTSDEPGESEVFVQGRAAGEFKWQVSNGGGNFPRWRRDGKELYYRALDGNLMSTPVRASANGLEFGKATTLFRIVEPMGTFAYPYDAAPDGQRILTLVPSGGGPSLPPLTLLVNWEAGLKR